MIQEKNKIYQLYLKNKSNMSATKIEILQNLIYETPESCKSKYNENISKNYAPKPQLQNIIGRYKDYVK